MENTFFDQKNLGEFQALMKSRIKFKLALVKMLPLASLVGIRMKRLDDSTCELTVPFKWLNKNPFGTTYWAVMGMVSEMASGLLLLMYTYKLKPSVSTFVIGCEAKFHKRATGITVFKCNQGYEIAEKVKQTCESFEPQEIVCIANGYNLEGELVAEFKFTWGIKARKN